MPQSDIDKLKALKRGLKTVAESEVFAKRSARREVDREYAEQAEQDFWDDYNRKD